jgi:hypothetical protein
MEKLEDLNGGRQSAIKRQSGRPSNFQVFLPCLLGSGHWIGGTLFSRLIGSNAAGTDIGDAASMRFERPVSGAVLPVRWLWKITQREETRVRLSGLVVSRPHG